MSTDTDPKEQAAAYRESASVLSAAADTLLRKAAECDETVRKAQRSEAFDRVAKVACELQETSEGCDALLELVNLAVADLNGSDDPRTDTDWSPTVRRYLAAFALVFTLDRDALTSWVSDVAWDQWQDEQVIAAQEEAAETAPPRDPSFKEPTVLETT